VPVEIFEEEEKVEKEEGIFKFKETVSIIFVYCTFYCSTKIKNNVEI
jgi:hypothetical protein